MGQPGRFRGVETSEAFRLAYSNAGGNKPLYLGHPEFEGFDAVQEINAG